MIQIELPGVLQELADHQGIVEVEGKTVQQALDDLGQRHPMVLTRILTRGGRLRPHVNLFLGGRDIRQGDGLETPVADGDELLVVPSVAGG
ncbi:MAG TPA: ubiquitin-like small modifier protein 1 [Wenzhouxiangella sp.]|nr:ubiquitin-like small modifier protein 1 [Wenzhouxiangella sp.]